MELKWIEENDVLPTTEPLIAAVAFDESHAVLGLLDDGFEHNILLRKVLGTDEDLDKYFRIVFDLDGADWIFVCPVAYKGITNKEKRITQFYHDGIDTIVKFLKQLGYPEVVEIPKRYRRHFNYMTDGSF